MEKFMKGLAYCLGILCVVGSLILGVTANDVAFVVYGIASAAVTFGVLYSIGCELERLNEIRDLLVKIQQKEPAAIPLISNPAIFREAPQKEAWASGTTVGKAMAVCAKVDVASEVKICTVDRSFLSVECPFCHKEQKSNRNVCLSCGAKFVGEGDEVRVERTGLEIICPRCEKKQPSNAERCIRCGVHFGS